MNDQQLLPTSSQSKTGYGSLTSNERKAEPFLLDSLAKLKQHVESCGQSALLSIQCADCGTIQNSQVITVGNFPSHPFSFKTRLHCQSRFDSKCFATKYGKAIKRLLSYQINSPRVVHTVFGFPDRPSEFRLKKKIHQKVIQTFKNEFNKLSGIYLTGVKIFDFQDLEEGRIHYHNAFLPFNIKDVRILKWSVEAVNRTIKKTNQQFIFKIIGFRPWQKLNPGDKRQKGSKLQQYFAKRVAGLYGDYPNEWFLDDRMTIEDYFNNFFRTKELTSSRRISCINVPLIFECEVCGFNRCLIFIEIYEGIDVKPEFTQNRLRSR